MVHDPVAALNLSLAHETSLLASSVAGDAVIPAVVISGFLGSGKSTLVQHLLRNRGGLKIAVLVNEVGQVDIDSQLLKLKQSNAVVGLPASDLAGGCMCCAKQDQLRSALVGMRDSDGRPDYLVLETSGVGEPEALAVALRTAGFRLDAIVTVVDAEAAQHTLQLPVAQQQVRLADIVVLNKCDLATLSQVGQVEDLIHAMVPDVRTVVRARFGQVPLPLVLDVQSEPACSVLPADKGVKPVSIAAAVAPATPIMPADSGHGFLSHEAPVACGSAYQSGAVAAQPRRRRVPRVEQQQQQQLQQQEQQQQLQQPQQQQGSQLPEHPHQHHKHNGQQQSSNSSPGHRPWDSADEHAHGASVAAGHVHAQLHEGFCTRSVTMAEAPLPMAWLQQFLTDQLLKASGLLRAKGVVWIAERRRQRFVLHLSGRQRAECCSEAAWDSTPMTQLVFIGTDEHALDQLVAVMTQLLRSSLEAQPPLSVVAQQHQPGDGKEAGSLLSAQPSNPSTLPAALVSTGARQLLPSVPFAQPPADILAALGATGNWDSRLELLRVQPCCGLLSDSVGSQAVGSSSEGSPQAQLVEFSAASVPLHGVVGAEVNAALMLAINRTGRAFVFGTRMAGAISATTLMQQADRVASLMLAVPSATSLPASPNPWQDVQAAADPVLRKVFRNVVHCNCDATSHS